MKYVYYHYENFFNFDEAEALRNYCLNNPSNFFYDIPGHEKNCKTSVIETKPSIKNLPFFEKYFDVVRMTNDKHFGFKLFDTNPLGFNYNIYEKENNEYSLHRDTNELGSSSDIKLTAILNLSNKEYTGGQFVMRFDGDELHEIVELNKPLSLIVFPSFYYHGVNPVTSGQRISLSCWFEGPNWK